MLGTKKKDIPETTIVKTTEKFRIFTKGIKWTFIILFSIFTLYFLFLVFGVYIFGSFFISFSVSSVILYNTMEVPSERFLECKIEMEKDSDGNKKPRTHILNEYDIPVDLLKEFKLIGDTIVRFKSKNGKTRNIVEKIDFIKKEIHYCWFARFSDWDFMVTEETFEDVKEKLQKTVRNLLRHEKTRELYYQIELYKEYQDIHTDKTIYNSEIDKLREQIKTIFKEEKGGNLLND